MARSARTPGKACATSFASPEGSNVSTRVAMATLELGFSAVPSVDWPDTCLPEARLFGVRLVGARLAVRVRFVAASSFSAAFNAASAAAMSSAVFETSAVASSCFAFANAWMTLADDVAPTGIAIVGSIANATARSSSSTFARQ